MKGRFPLVALQIQVHPAAVDVNVHPTKSEVKFRQPQLVGRTLGQAVRDAVQQTAIVQRWADSAAPPERSATTSTGRPEPAGPSDSVAAPAARTFEANSSVDVDDARMFQSAAQPMADTRFEGPLADRTAPPAPATDRSPEPDQLGPMPVQTRLIDDQAGGDVPFDRPDPDQLRDQEWSARMGDRAAADQILDRVAAPGVDLPNQSGQPPTERHLRETPAHYGSPAAPLPDTAEHGAPTSATRARGLPPLRALAQLAQTYLLTEGPGGALYLIDQHAAHERITYERLLAQHAAGTIQSQALLLPQHVPLPPDVQQALLGAADELAAWGFALDEADRGVQVRAVPAGLAIEMLETTLADLASQLGGRGGRTPVDQRDGLLATLACHTSVRAGQTLSLVEQQALIDQLIGCEGPNTCPHGRPTLIVVTKHQLERQFGRLGA
jgi:DNA mismatch repair ATPase MutL